jgi:hypothetical protein
MIKQASPWPIVASGEDLSQLQVDVMTLRDITTLAASLQESHWFLMMMLMLLKHISSKTPPA